jgi:hypothetical protein
MSRFLSVDTLVGELAQDRNLTQWLVSPEGVIYDSTQFCLGAVPDEMRFREACVIGAAVFTSDAHGLFDFDRSPDYVTVPADLAGETLLARARELVEAIEKADVAQTEFLDATEHHLYACRRMAGEATVQLLTERFDAAQAGMVAARGAEWAARNAFDEAFVARNNWDASA